MSRRWLVVLLTLAGCGHAEEAGTLAPTKATGGILRAVFGTQAARGRLQWRNASEPEPGACREALRRAGVVFTSLGDRAAPGADGCGIPHGVTVTRGPTGIAYQPPLQANCALALDLADVERVIQQEAAARLGARIVRIRTFGTYSCRVMRGWRSTWSEHSFGNAVDVAAFDTSEGRAITVVQDFRASTPAGEFLRRVHDRLRAETKLSYVLGPDHDAAHHNHFHLDHGVRWTAF
jgi:hypothetical protein